MAHVVDESSAGGNPRSKVARFLLIWLLRSAGLCLAICAIIYGLHLRDNLWTWSAPIRFTGDIGNGLNQGTAVLHGAIGLARADGLTVPSVNPEGQVSWRYFFRSFIRRYDRVVARSHDDRYDLDYTPARLLVMSLWAHHVRKVDPPGINFAQQDALPLLRLNTGCEIAAALFTFLIVRHWIRRGGHRAGEWAWILGLIAALISWFNPSTLADAHMWPQWDVWIVPFYLAAIYFASIEWWFVAGISVAMGAMFKGQVMMVAPVLVLWPLFGGRWLAVIRMIVGFLFTAALAASPWLARNPQAWEWIGSVLLIGMVSAVIGKRGLKSPRGNRWRWPIWSFIPIIALVVRPRGATHWDAISLGAAVAITPLLAPRLSRTSSTVWLAMIATACIVISASTFSGTWSWFSVGFEFPTRHYMNMGNGGASNLGALLENYYDWHVEDLVLQIHKTDVTMKALLITIYALTLVLCAIGAALHDRRNDPRVLISLTAPWVLMFAILPQMHERYLMWGAAVCGVAVAASLAMELLHLVVVGLSFIILGRDLFDQNSHFAPEASRFFEGTHPGIGWMVLLAAIIFLYVAVIPRRRNFAQQTTGFGGPPIDFIAGRSYALVHANQASEAVGSTGTVPDDPERGSPGD